MGKDWNDVARPPELMTGIGRNTRDRRNSPNRQPLPEWPEWMDLKTLEHYSSVSNRTLRNWIRAPENPVPAVTHGGKILVSRQAFDDWMKGQAIKVSSVDVKRIVDEILESL